MYKNIFKCATFLNLNNTDAKRPKSSEEKGSPLLQEPENNASKPLHMLSALW